MQSSEPSAELDAFITTVRRFVRDQLWPAEAQVGEDDDIETDLARSKIDHWHWYRFDRHADAHHSAARAHAATWMMT